MASPRFWRFSPSRSPEWPGPPAPEPTSSTATAMIAGAEPVRAGAAPPGTTPVWDRAGRAQPAAADHVAAESWGDPKEAVVLRRYCSPAVTCLAAKLQMPPEESKLGQEPWARPHDLSLVSPHRLKLPAGELPTFQNVPCCLELG